MNEEEAFETLGLSKTATQGEINARLRELAAQAHPDKGGNNAAMSELLTARDKALKAVAKRASIDPAKEISRINTEIEKRMGQQEVSQLLAEEIFRRRSKHYRKIMLMSIAFAAVSGAVTLLGTGVIILIRVPEEITSISAAFTVLSTLAYFFSSSMAGDVKEELREISDLLDYRPSYLALINTIKLNFLPPPPWSKHHFEALVNTWLTSSSSEPLRIRLIAQKMGKTDFSNLLLSKGIEFGVIKTHETIEDGAPGLKYSLKDSEGQFSILSRHVLS